MWKLNFIFNSKTPMTYNVLDITMYNFLENKTENR